MTEQAQKAVAVIREGIAFEFRNLHAADAVEALLATAEVLDKHLDAIDEERLERELQEAAFDSYVSAWPN